MPRLSASLILLILVAGGEGRPALGAALPVARVFAPPALNGPVVRDPRISPDGRFVTFLKPDPADPNSFDLWSAATADGVPRILIKGSAVEPKALTLSDEEKSRRERQRTASDHGVLEYQWSNDSRSILIPAGDQLYVVDPDTNVLRALPRQSGGVIDAKLSPRGDRVTFVLDHNLHVLDIASGRDLQLTHNGAGAVSYGVAEFVAEEEMERYTGAWTAPDESRIAYTRVDETSVDVIPRVDIGAGGIAVVEQRYPRAGRPNARVDLFIQALTGGPPVAVELGSDPEAYLARVDWSASGAALYVQRENRSQTRLDLLEVDPKTGRSHVLLTERQTPWINLNNDFTPLASGDFVWGSERTGFHHLYLYDAAGALKRAVTQGPWPVAMSGGGRLQPSPLHVDEARGLVYFLASAASPLHQDLYVTSYLTPQAPRRITDGRGWWSAEVGADGASYVGAYTDVRTPPQTALFSLDGSRRFWLEENRLGPQHPYAPYLDHRSDPEFGSLPAADGQTLEYEILKPFDFDPARRYPAIVEVYGGPGVQTVQDRWGAATDQLLTQAGYVVFRLDNRGSSNRGIKFEAPLYRAMGGAEVADQLTGTRFLASLPYVDPQRLGVSGWSYGGYMTLRLLTAPNTPFAAGAAGAPPSDWSVYDTHYTERYMGDPRREGGAYRQSAILPRLPALSRTGAPRLLLLQGMADDNVLFENSTQIMAALQQQSTPFDLMLFPGQRHGLRDPATKTQLWLTYLEFFNRWLGASAPPRRAGASSATDVDRPTS